MRTLECRRGSRRIVCSGFIILRELIPLLTDLDLQFRLIEDEGQKQKLPTFFVWNFHITDPTRLESYQLYFFTMFIFNGKTRPRRVFSYQLYFDTTQKR